MIKSIKKKITPLLEAIATKKLLSTPRTTSMPQPIFYDNQTTQHVSSIITQILNPLAQLVDAFAAYFIQESFEMPVSQSSEYTIKHASKLDANVNTIIQYEY